MGPAKYTWNHLPIDHIVFDGDCSSQFARRSSLSVKTPFQNSLKIDHAGVRWFDSLLMSFGPLWQFLQPFCARFLSIFFTGSCYIWLKYIGAYYGIRHIGIMVGDPRNLSLRSESSIPGPQTCANSWWPAACHTALPQGKVCDFWLGWSGMVENLRNPSDNYHHKRKVVWGQPPQHDREPFLLTHGLLLVSP